MQAFQQHAVHASCSSQVQTGSTAVSLLGGQAELLRRATGETGETGGRAWSSVPAGIKTGRSADFFWRMGPDAAICAAAGGQDKAGIDREDCEALEKAVRGLLLEQSMRRQRQQASAAEALFTGRREAGITFSRRKVCAVAS